MARQSSTALTLAEGSLELGVRSGMNDADAAESYPALATHLRVVYLVPYLARGGTERHLIDLVRTIRWEQRPWVVAPDGPSRPLLEEAGARDRKSTRLNSSHVKISYAVFCLKKKKNTKKTNIL